MVLFDEATSAIDAPTECKIYARLIELHVWFVTISHRSSLNHLHAISLRFVPTTDQHQSVEEVRTESHTPMFNDGGDDGNISIRRELSHRFPKQIDNQLPLSNVKEKVTPRWRLVFDILRFIHVPFQSTDGVLKLQVRNQSDTTSASGSFHRQWSCGYWHSLSLGPVRGQAIVLLNKQHLCMRSCPITRVDRCPLLKQKIQSNRISPVMSFSW